MFKDVLKTADAAAKLSFKTAIDLAISMRPRIFDGTKWYQVNSCVRFFSMEQAVVIYLRLLETRARSVLKASNFIVLNSQKKMRTKR